MLVIQNNEKGKKKIQTHVTGVAVEKKKRPNRKKKKKKMICV
jgi:hypothetical protein